MTATPAETADAAPVRSTEVSPPQKKRRGRTARFEVASVLVGVSLLSLLVVGIYNFVQAQDLLNGQVESTLIDIGSARTANIESGLVRLEAATETIAADLGVAAALREFSDGIDALDQGLDQAQLDELATAYETSIAEAAESGVPLPPAGDLLPKTEWGRYLQYQYIAQNPFDGEERFLLIDAGDGSQYSAAHAQHHPTFVALRDSMMLGDLILVDAASASVVYTVDKRVDYATNLVAGPYRESALATVILEELAKAGAGDAVLVDFELYAPALGAPTMFAAAAIREGGEVIGALAAAVPNEIVVDITTAGQDWEGTGLGETGEVFIVGPDNLMRSDSRLWLESPDAYLEAAANAGHGPEVTETVEALDTTVLIQPVETNAVDAALAGEVFTGDSVNYLDEKTLTVSAPLESGTLRWVVVAEVTRNEAYREIRDHIRRVLILAVILIPVLAVVGWFMATRILRPIRPILDAAREVGAGDLDVELPFESRDEFGSLAATFNDLVEAMREQERELARAEAEITELLSAVLPQRVVDQARRGDTDISEAVRNATIVVIAVKDPKVADPVEQQMIVDHSIERAAALSELATSRNVEALRASAGRDVFATGLNATDADSDRALEFVIAARELVTSMAQNEAIDAAFRGGVAAGDVVMGIIGTERVSFDVWGEPRRQATALAEGAQPGQIVVESALTGTIQTDWAVARAADVVDATGMVVEGWTLRGKAAT